MADICNQSLVESQRLGEDARLFLAILQTGVGFDDLHCERLLLGDDFPVGPREGGDSAVAAMVDLAANLDLPEQQRFERSLVGDASDFGPVGSLARASRASG